MPGLYHLRRMRASNTSGHSRREIESASCDQPAQELHQLLARIADVEREPARPRHCVRGLRERDRAPAIWPRSTFSVARRATSGGSVGQAGETAAFAVSRSALDNRLEPKGRFSSICPASRASNRPQRPDLGPAVAAAQGDELDPSAARP